MDRLKDKVIIVTGGASGIGRSACILAAREGATVCLTDVSDDEGRAGVEQIRREHGIADDWHLNVASESQVRTTFSSIVERFGRIDVLVNNAGISGPDKPTDEITEEEWDALLSVDLKSVFFCTKHAVPYMKARRRGNIINMSSIYGIVGAADVPPYHAAKGAVRIMTKNDALLYARDGIRVNSVHPGFVWTPLVERLGANQPGGSAPMRAALTAKHPIGRLGEPDDIGWAVVFLASDESAFMTGSELVVDGGYTAQ
jgi:NAD(P)-dependent dehydrogenase (short-subunit alcohol dehydrogenase family)